MGGAGKEAPAFTVSVTGSQAVQVGNDNAMTNVGVDASAMPPAQRVTRDATVHNLPPASGVFVGRDLTELAELLPTTDGVVVGQAAVHGLGGIGKTELVLQYAREHAAGYELVWWVTAAPAPSACTGSSRP